MSTNSFKSASYLEKKQVEEHFAVKEQLAKQGRERRVMLGYFVVALLATLFISGALKMDQVLDAIERFTY